MSFYCLGFATFLLSNAIFAALVRLVRVVFFYVRD